MEFFGGIIINKVTFDRLELTFDEALFIRASEFLSIENSEKLVCKILNKNHINISRLYELQLFQSTETTPIDYDTVYSLLESEYKKIKGTPSLSFPLEITIYPSMKCNLNCKFCFLGNKSDKKIWDAEHWGKLIEEAKNNGLLSVSILGGEPALYYDIDNLLRKCESLKINTIITTNALKLKDTTKQIIFNSHYITPAVSIQSLDNLNSLLMGCDYKKQLNFIEECLSHKKEVRINSVYTFQTKEQILRIYDYCVEKGISRYSVANYSNTKNNPEMKFSHTLSDLAQLDKIVKDYIEEKYSNNKDLPEFSAEGCMLFSCYADEINDKLSFSPFEKQYFGCRGKYTKMEIFSDGSVYPCYRFETVTKSTSNVFEQDTSLSDIWWNDYNYKQIRNQEIKTPVCLNCPFIEICKGGCYPSRIKENALEVSYTRDKNCQHCKGI